MSLTQGDVLPDVKTTTNQATTAPGYYTDYLSALSKAGTTATTLAETPGVNAKNLVAGFDALQTQGFDALPGLATGYTGQLGKAQATAGDVAQGITTEDISGFMNPYTTAVTDEMARKTQQNLQQNILPSLKGMFTATGGLGSQRMMNATGQTMADIQANLTGQQAGALQKGYSDAVMQALQEGQMQNQAAQTQGNLAGMGQELGLAGNKALLDSGAIKQAYEQAKIEAPLKMASNAAALMRGYQIPTSTNQTVVGPMPGAYGASPLQSALGVAALFTPGKDGSSAAAGVVDAAGKVYNTGKDIYTDVTNSDWYKNLFN